MSAETPRITRELIAAMRESADVMEVANTVGGIEPNDVWTAIGIRNRASEWERQLDAEEAMVDQLTRFIAGTMTDSSQYEQVAWERSAPIAREIVANFDVKPKGRSA